MLKWYVLRKRIYWKKSRKITRFCWYCIGMCVKVKSYFRFKRVVKNYIKLRKIWCVKKQYKYTAGKGVKNKIKYFIMFEFVELFFYDVVRFILMVIVGGKFNMYDNIIDNICIVFKG